MRRPSQVCRSDVADQRYWSFAQGVNRAPIRTLFGPGAGCMIKFDPPGCCNLCCAHMHCMAPAQGRSHPNAVWISLDQGPATPVWSPERQGRLAFFNCVDYAVLRRGAGLLPRRQNGVGAVLRDRAPCFSTVPSHRMPKTVASPLGGTGGGSRVRRLPHWRRPPGRARSSFRSSRG